MNRSDIAGHSSSRVGPPRLLAILVVGLCAVGACLSGPGPADPLWVEGIYDGADAEDVAELPTIVRITPERTAPFLLRPLRVVAGGSSDHFPAAICISAPQLRSLPAA